MLFFLASRLMLENSSRRFRPEDSGQIFIDLKRFAKTVYFQHVQLYVGSLFLNMIILQKLSKNQVFDLFNSLSVFIIQANQKTLQFHICLRRLLEKRKILHRYLFHSILLSCILSHIPAP
jgi:hypothetical protein